MQPRPCDHNARAPPPPPAPRALRWLVVGVLASIILLIALPIVMMIDQAGLKAAIEEDTGAGLDPEWMDWARITLTAYLVVASYFSLYSATRGAMFLWAVIPTDILPVLMIGLLWIPAPVRRYFKPQRPTAHQPRRRRTTYVTAAAHRRHETAHRPGRRARACSTTTTSCAAVWFCETGFKEHSQT